MEPRCSAFCRSDPVGRLHRNSKESIFLTESDDHRGPLDDLNRLSDHSPTLIRDAATCFGTRPARDPRNEDRRDQEGDENRDRGDREPDQGEQGCDQGDDDRYEWWGGDADEDVLDLVDVVDHPPDEIAGTERCDACRAQPVDGPNESSSEIGEKPQAQVMRHDAFEIAEHGA